MFNMTNLTNFFTQTDWEFANWMGADDYNIAAYHPRELDPVEQEQLSKFVTCARATQNAIRPLACWLRSYHTAPASEFDACDSMVWLKISAEISDMINGIAGVENAIRRVQGTSALNMIDKTIPSQLEVNTQLRKMVNAANKIRIAALNICQGTQALDLFASWETNASVAAIGYAISNPLFSNKSMDQLPLWMHFAYVQLMLYIAAALIWLFNNRIAIIEDLSGAVQDFINAHSICVGTFESIFMDYYQLFETSNKEWAHSSSVERTFGEYTQLGWVMACSILFH